MAKYAGKTNAPDFPPDLDWLNTDAPLSLKQLRGRIVLLDFWTYCCINCMHIIPDLKRLEKKYPSEIVVIGVHSAKFQSERDTANILQAVMRYEVEHPVVNDSQMILWREYGIRAWPSVVVIDPLGKVVGIASGEGVFENLDPVISEMIGEFEASGQLQRQEFRMTPASARMPQTVLSFPGKVLADAASGRLFIADSNHNRILICGFDGMIQDVAGSGATGCGDGAFEVATFNHPQGMCLIGDALFVADTDNHALRRMTLATRQVETVSGDGTQSRRIHTAEMPARSARLNSPWDLAAIADSIYIAMAGPHQIWRLDLRTHVIGPIIGSGREALVDGPLSEAALAQPSGITTDGERLYFADSETSSIRSASLGKNGEVRTLVGTGLFDFGDSDGTGDQARLQHPLGIVFHRDALFVADTYNSKIRKLALSTREVTSIAGSFDQPAGISAAENLLYVADTNNHVIKIVDLDARSVTALQLRGLEKLRRRDRWSGDSIVLREPIVIHPGPVSIVLEVALPAEYKLTASAPTRVLFSLNEGAVKYLADRPEAFPLRWEVDVTAASVLNVLVEVYFCHDGEAALCFYKEALFTIPVEVSSESNRRELRVVFDPLAPSMPAISS